MSIDQIYGRVPHENRTYTQWKSDICMKIGTFSIRTETFNLEVEWIFFFLKKIDFLQKDWGDKILYRIKWEVSYMKEYILSIIKAKNAGIPVGTASIFNAEYRQEIFLDIRHVPFNSVLTGLCLRSIKNTIIDFIR